MTRTPTLLLTFLSVSLSGCMIGALKEQHDATQAFVAEGQANAVEAQANRRTTLFAASGELWSCPDPDAARANAECEGGKRYPQNADVVVIGEAPEEDLWRSEYYATGGAHPGYVLASAVNELPDLGHMEEMAAEVEARYSAEQRIPMTSVNYVDLVGQPKAFAGRVLVLEQASTDRSNMTFEDGVFSFTLPIRSSRGSRYAASLAQFELASERIVEELQAGQRSYRCGPGYCDRFLMVARLTGRTADRVDERGQVHRLPVFEILEMGDRYGRHGTRQ